MQENAVVIASKEREAVLYLAEDAPRALRIACTNFLTDLNKICGCPARMTHDAREANVLVGAGNGRRGAVYGGYDLSRRFGVSPWYFFADVPVKKRRCVSLPAGYCKTDWPCVQYRGIFLNDEEELDA